MSQHNAFDLIDRHRIASLNLDLLHYRDARTGAEHYHLASDHTESVFAVALRTVPRDNTGVAHILEHTVLCGSERYPIRDPFFMMMRRSLNTFMNAFTSSDWTAYPFASENRKDFFNLLDVYLDSVFFSNLDELDFHQEGHRLALKAPDDPDSELEYRGVVYNEMKGAMSSASARLYQTLTKYLFPTTTYHYNSGGEPQAIPDLTHQQLKQFYQRHYHPGNAIFLTFGDVDPEQVQLEITDKVLQRTRPAPDSVSVPFEQRFHAPVQVLEHYPVAPSDDDTGPQDHVVVGWLLGESTDVKGQLEANFLTDVLMENSSSPLREALETTDLGTSVSPLMGVEDSNREMMFVCGLEGTAADRADEVETLVLDTLRRVAEEGVPMEDQLAVLHQLELAQREIGGDGMPFGLQLIMTALPAAVHRGDVEQALDVDEALASLRADLQKPDYLRGLIDRLLLNNPHRVRLTLKADPEFSARAEREERDRLSRIAAGLSSEQRDAIRALNEKLEAHQKIEPDMDQLPKVTLDDIPATLKDRRPVTTTDTVTAYEEGTNGLGYLAWLMPVENFAGNRLHYLPLYSALLSEVGMGDASYQDVQRQQSRVSGGIAASLGTRTELDNPDRFRTYLTVGSKALNRNTAAMNELLRETVKNARFDETDRLHDLLQMMLTRRQQAVTGRGHVLAMTAASAAWSRGAALNHAKGGLAGLQWLKQTVKSDKSAYINEVRQELEAVHAMFAGSTGHMLAIGESGWLNDNLNDLTALWADQAGRPAAAVSGEEVDQPDRHTAWLTDTPVNFCGRAFRTVPVQHEDAAALAVLAGVLTNGFLHTAVREQGGAYGGGANHDLNNGVFRFFSYRDPRMTETLNDFSKAVEWLLGRQLGYQPIEESVLSLISGMDKPSSPAGEARIAFFNDLFDRDLGFREQLRQRVLSVGEEDLKRVAERYLQPELAANAVVTGADHEEEARGLGMTVHRL